MNARLGLILATAALLTGSGCAAGGGGVSEGPAAVPTLPGAGGQVLAEGIRPRDNAHTRAAEGFLNDAMNATDEVERAQLYQQAHDAAMEGIAADPQNPKSYFQAGIAKINLKDYFGADSMISVADSLHPRYVLETDPWRERGWVDAYNEGIVPLNEGDLETAAAIFEGANALYSQRPEALLQLGSVYSRLNDPAKSADAFRGALDILEGSREMAMMDSAQAITWEEHYDIASLGLGQALQYSEQWEEAAELYGRLLADDPENPSLIGSLASVLTELEMPDSVDALYDNLLNRPGLTEFDYSNAGVGLYRIEQYERAAQAFRAAADMNPFNRDARLNLTQTYFSAEDWENLIPAARELLELDPLNGLVWIFMTRAYSELEQTEQANEVFNEYQALGVETENIMLDALPNGGARVTGSLKNNTAEEGGTVTLRFHFGGQSGTEIGTLDIRVQVPAAETSVEFGADFNSSETVTGYSYEKIG
jgi:tetratricopeptide (TPR) repeat protein